MKKLIWIAMTLVLTIGLLTGCGGKNLRPEPTPSPTPQPTAVPTPTPVPTPVPYEKVVESHSAGYTVPVDSAEVYSAVSNAWDVEAKTLTYAGENAAPAEPEDGAVTLYKDSAAEYMSAGIPVSNGTQMYVLSGTTLHILSADGADSVLLASVPVGSGWSDTQEGQEPTWGGFEKYPSRLYLSGNRLVVLSNWYGYESYIENEVNVCDYTEYTCIDIYDVTDPVAPMLLASFGQDGTCSGAAVSDGAFYLVTEHAVYSDADASDPSAFLPQLYTAAGASPMDPSRIILPNEVSESVYGVVGVYGLETAARVDALAVLGVNGEIVLDAPSVYLMAEHYTTAVSANYRDNVYDVSECSSAASTDVYRLEASSGALTVKETGTVMGHLAGERAAAVLSDTLNLALQKENFRYTLYADAGNGTENILWGDLEVGESVVSMPASLQSATESESEVFHGYLYNWTEGRYVGFGRDESGALKLSMLTPAEDGTLQEISSKVFGNDYSKTLSSADAIYVNGERNILGFAADDGYSFYRYDEENGLVSLFDTYLTDWPWHVRCTAAGDYLYMMDRNVVYVYSLADMALIHSLTL